jgi:hypothetical protein
MNNTETIINFWGNTKMFVKPVIILISGLAFHGKTTTAEYLKEEFENHNYKVDLLHFASGVKRVSKECFNWDGIKDEKGRKLLQDIGKVGREYNKDIWVDQVIEEIKFGLGLFDVYIIDDWRFPNELLRIEDENFWLDSITMRVQSNFLRDDKTDYNDVSETSLPENDKNMYNYIVPNHGTKEQLKEFVNSIYLDIMEEN